MAIAANSASTPQITANQIRSYPRNWYFSDRGSSPLKKGGTEVSYPGPCNVWGPRAPRECCPQAPQWLLTSLAQISLWHHRSLAWAISVAWADWQWSAVPLTEAHSQRGLSHSMALIKLIEPPSHQPKAGKNARNIFLKTARVEPPFTEVCLQSTLQTAVTDLQSLT